MLLLSFELKETLGKIRPTYLYLKKMLTTINTRSNYEEQAFNYRLWVKTSALSSVDETLLLLISKKTLTKVRQTYFTFMKQKI